MTVTRVSVRLCYTLGGAGIRVNGSGRITANEALLYIEAGQVELSGTGMTRLKVPDTGEYAGVSVFQSRTLTNQVALRGGSLTSGTGVIYAQAARVTVFGSTNSSNMQVISDTFQMSGESSLELDFEHNVIIDHSSLRLVE